VRMSALSDAHAKGDRGDYYVNLASLKGVLRDGCGSAHPDQRGMELPKNSRLERFCNLSDILRLGT